MREVLGGGGDRIVARGSDTMVIATRDIFTRMLSIVVTLSLDVVRKVQSLVDAYGANGICASTLGTCKIRSPGIFWMMPWFVGWMSNYVFVGLAVGTEIM